MAADLQLSEGVEYIKPEGLKADVPDINEQLLVAAKRGDVEKVKHCLEMGAAVDTQSGIGMTPLYRAVFWNKDEVVEYLMNREEKPNVELKDDDGETPLWRAVAEGNEKNINVLLERGADVNAKDSRGVSVLLRAVGENAISIVRLILAHQPDVNVKSDARDSPLLRAAINNNADIAGLLIKSGAKIGSLDSEGDSELSQAAYHGNIPLAELLLKQHADIESTSNFGMTPFLWAAQSGHASVGQLLLEEGADAEVVEDDGYTALHWAASFGRVEFTEMLLKGLNQALGAGETPAVQSAPGAGSAETKQKLPRTKFDIEAKNKVGETPLHVASANGYTEIVALLASRANFSARDSAGWTALHHGAYGGGTKVVQLLLAKMKPATVIVKDTKGNTALHFASRTRNDELVNILLNESHIRNTIAEKNIGGETALSIATSQKAKGIVQLLVNAEADLSYVPSEEGPTGQSWPKMERTNPKQVEAISFLLTANEEHWKDIKDSEKQTLYWAARTGNRSLVDKILERPGVDRKNVLYWAAVGGQRDIVQLLREKYTKDNSADKTFRDIGPRAVLDAARNGHAPVVQQILRIMELSNDFKFKTDTPDSITEKWTPLHWAVNYKAEEPDEAAEVIRHLLMNGANPEMDIGAESDSAIGLARHLKDSSKFTEFNTAIVSLLETPLRLPRKPLQLLEPALASGGAQNVCKQFFANIIDFYPSDGRFYTLERKTSVYDIIYNEGPQSMMSEAKENWNIKLEHRFRWIHLPANNWIWVEDLMRRLSYESAQSADEYTRLSNFVEQNRREHIGKTQCRFMYPALTFETKDFHQSDGANITKLQSEAKKQEQRRAQKQKPPGKPQNTHSMAPKIGDAKGPNEAAESAGKHQNDSGNGKERSDEDGGYGEVRGDLSPIGEKSTNKKDNKPLDQGQPDSRQQATVGESKLEKQRMDKKVKPSEESEEIIHLGGCKLAASIPFLTFQSVKSHRKLRQAIRLAEEVHRLSNTIPKPPEDVVSESKVEPARIGMVEREIRQGNDLLKRAVKDYNKNKSVSATYDKLHKLQGMVGATKRKMDNKLEWKSDLESLGLGLKDIKKELLTSELLEWHERFEDAIDIFDPTNIAKEIPSKHEALLQQYLRPDKEKGLHASRTIDQYYYSSLADTSRRDIDQVVRRYQARMKTRAEQQKNQNEDKMKQDKGNEAPVDDSKFQMGMVDQLWLWVIDDKTVITCFPQSIDREANQPELLEKIRAHIHEDSRPEISSIYHLATTITSFCVGFVEDCVAQLDESPESFLHMFASSIGKVADEEVKYFEAFKRELGESDEAKNISSALRELDLQNEITLLEEVKDIRDELNILQSICEDQKDLLHKLSCLIARPRGVAEQEIEKDPILNYYKERSDINLRIDKIRKLQTDATTTYDSLNHLLDLKQKNANISEAVESRKQAEQTRVQAEQTTKQGRTILVFTIVTIIFLPMSFLTSLFALNIRSFPHQGENLSYPSEWIFSRIFGTSAALAIPLVLIAIYINSFLKMFDDPSSGAQKNAHTSASSSRHAANSHIPRATDRGGGPDPPKKQLSWPKKTLLYKRETSSSSPESLQEEGKANGKGPGHRH